MERRLTTSNGSTGGISSGNDFGLLHLRGCHRPHPTRVVLGLDSHAPFGVGDDPDAAQYHVSTVFAASERLKLTVLRMKSQRWRGIRMSQVALLNRVDHSCECNVVGSVGKWGGTIESETEIRDNAASWLHYMFLVPKIVIRYGYIFVKSKRKHYLTQNATWTCPSNEFEGLLNLPPGTDFVYHWGLQKSYPLSW